MFAIREEIDQAHALSASLADVQRQGHVSVINQQLAHHTMIKSESSAAASAEPSAKYQGRVEDFPTLDGVIQTKQKPDVAINPDANSGPLPEMSLAKKLAMSSRLSVRNGPVDLADFPSLPGARQTKTRKGPSMLEEDFPTLSSISQAKLSKTSAPSVWSAGSNGSGGQAQPFSQAEKSVDSQHKNVNDDFPSLSMAFVSDRNTSIPEKPLSCNSLVSISRNFSSGSLSSISNPVEPASAPSSLSWGPELNRKSDNKQQEKKEPEDSFLHLKSHKSSCRSTVHEAWGADSGRLATSELSSHAKQVATNSNISDKSTVSLMKASAVPSNTATREKDGESETLTDSSPCWIQVRSEKKTEFRPLKKDDTKLSSNKVSDAQKESKKTTNSSGKTDGISSNSKNGHKDKSKKKQKANKTQKEPRVVTTSSDNAEKQSVEPAVVVVSEKTELEKVDGATADKRELSKAMEALDSYVAGDDSVQNSVKEDTSEGSCNGATVDNPTVDVTQSSDVAAVIPVFTADDFPSLLAHQLAPSSLPSLPPGSSSLTVSTSVPRKSEWEKTDALTPDKRELSEAVEECDSNFTGNGSEQSSVKQDTSEGGCNGITVNNEATELVTFVDTNPAVNVTQSSDIASAVSVLTTDDFPSLPVHCLALSSVPSLPPGFSSLTAPSSKPPPPGFANPDVLRCPPPGLSSVFPSLHAGDADKTSDVDLKVPSFVFIPPQDMEQRTVSFVSFIATAVKDGSFGEFHDLSAKFRAGNISADEYHSGCCGMMDPAAFLTIFPELIALLPDLLKQQQLLRVHRDFLSKSKIQNSEKSQPWCSTPDDGLMSCAVCGQVLRHSDLQSHASEHHIFNTEYPTLSNSYICYSH